MLIFRSQSKFLRAICALGLILSLPVQSQGFDVGPEYSAPSASVPNRPSRGIASDSKSQQVQKCIQENMNSNSMETRSQIQASCERFVNSNYSAAASSGNGFENAPFASPADCMQKNNNDENYCNNFNYPETGANGFPKSPYADALDCMAKNNYDQEYCNNYDYDDSKSLKGKGGAGEGTVAGSETPTESQAVNQAALCEQAHSTAMNDCDTERQSWMKNIQMAAQGLGPVMESGACGKLSAANVGASTSLATFKVMCNTATQACLTECKKPNPANTIEQTTMATRAKECTAKGTKAAEAEQAAAQGTQQLLAAVATCKSTFGVNANPFNINNDPYKGQTAEEIMAGLQPAGGAPLEYSGTPGSAAGTGNSNLDLSGLDTDDEPGKPRAAAKSAAGAPGGSMGSAGMGGGGGSSVDAGGGGTGGKRPSGGLLSNILSGFFGGGGGGSSLFGGTGRSKGGGLSSFFGGEKPQETKTPDLRQFMPGGKMDPRKARGLAGQRLNADGMSGPHGNIWRMINNRYQYKKASLLP